MSLRWRQFIILLFPLMLFFATLFSYHINNYPTKGDIYTINSATDSYVYQIKKSQSSEILSFLFVDTRDYKGSILPLAGLPFRLLFPKEIDSNRVFVSLMYLFLFASLSYLFAGKLGRLSAILLTVTFFSNDLFLNLINHFDSYLIFITFFCVSMTLIESASREKISSRIWIKRLILALSIFICFTTRPLESAILFISGCFFLRKEKIKHSVLFGTIFAIIWWLFHSQQFFGWWQGSTTIKSAYEFDFSKFLNMFSGAFLACLGAILWKIFTQRYRPNGGFYFYLAGSFGMIFFFVTMGMLNHDYFIVPLMLLFIGVARDTVSQDKNSRMSLFLILIGACYFLNFFSITFFDKKILPLEDEIRARRISNSFIQLREEVKQVLIPDLPVEIYNLVDGTKFNPLVGARQFMSFLKNDYELRQRFIWVDGFPDRENKIIVKPIHELCEGNYTYIFRFGGGGSPLEKSLSGYDRHAVTYLGSLHHIADRNPPPMTSNYPDFDVSIFLINCPKK